MWSISRWWRRYMLMIVDNIFLAWQCISRVGNIVLFWWKIYRSNNWFGLKYWAIFAVHNVQIESSSLSTIQEIQLSSILRQNFIYSWDILKPGRFLINWPTLFELFVTFYIIKRKWMGSWDCMSFTFKALEVEIFILLQRHVMRIVAIRKISSMERCPRLWVALHAWDPSLELKIKTKWLIELSTRQIYSFQITCKDINVRSDQYLSFQFNAIRRLYKSS